MVENYNNECTRRFNRRISKDEKKICLEWKGGENKVNIFE